MSTATVEQALLPITQAVVATGGSVRTGAVEQILSVMSQAAAGNTTFFTLRDSILVIGGIVELINETITEVVFVEAELLAVITDSLSSSIEAVGTPTFEVVINLEDIVTVGAQLNADHTTSLYGGTVQANDKLVAVATVVLADVATVNEALALAVVTELQDTVYVSGGVLTPGVTYFGTLQTSMRAFGDPVVFLQEAPTTTAVATSILVPFSVVYVSLVGTAHAADATVPTISSSAELLTSAFAASTVTFFGSVYNSALTDGVTASGYPWAKDFNAVAWVMNTETTGLSTYTNFQFTSLAEHNGAFYATSADGVYLLTGATDEGRDIAAKAKTGLLDFGREQTKRVSDVFLGYTGGELELDVSAAESVYTYLLEEREAAVPRNNRIKPGRGLSSRYWGFVLRNVAGAAFQLYDMTANVGTSKRRL